MLSTLHIEIGIHTIQSLACGEGSHVRLTTLRQRITKAPEIMIAVQDHDLSEETPRTDTGSSRSFFPLLRWTFWSVSVKRWLYMIGSPC